MAMHRQHAFSNRFASPPSTGVNLNTMLDSSNPAAAMGLSIVYQLGMSMVLMNLLIGVMCNSMAQAVQYEDIKGLLSRAQVLDELDTVMPDWLERLMPQNYPEFVVRRWEGLGH